MKTYHLVLVLQLLRGTVLVATRESSELVKRDISSTYDRPLSQKRALLNEAAKYLDQQISEIEEQIGETAESARYKVSFGARQTNLRSISYGSAVVAANLFYSWAAIYGKTQVELTNADYTLLLANTAYAYGYGVPFMADGQFESPDPGCGAQDIYQALDEFYLPPLYQLYSGLELADGSLSPALLIKPQYSTQNIRQKARERSDAVKDAASCLTSTSDGVELKSLLNRLDSAVASRLDVTDDIIRCIKEENAEHLN